MIQVHIEMRMWKTIVRHAKLIEVVGIIGVILEWRWVGPAGEIPSKWHLSIMSIQNAYAPYMQSIPEQRRTPGRAAGANGGSSIYTPLLHFRGSGRPGVFQFL